MPKNNKPAKTCVNCEFCEYVGEGDFVCMLDIPVWIQEDWIPTSEYFFCEGKEWIRRDSE